MGSSFQDEYREVFGDTQTSGSGSEILGLLSKIDQEKCHHEKVGQLGELDYCLKCGVALDNKGNEIDVKNCQHQDISETVDGLYVCQRCCTEIDCLHLDVDEMDNGLYACRKCCAEIEIYTFRPEWRFYGSADNRVNKDPSRCHYSKGSHKGLEDTFTSCNMQIPTAIKKATERKYNKVVQRLRDEKEKNTVRGKRKKSIVAACLLNAYRDFGEVRTAGHIREFFNLQQKSMSRGLQEYYKTFPEDRTASTNPENLLRWQMTLSGINISHYRKILTITKYLQDTSINLKRSNPQSVSAAILYFYLCLHPKYKEQLGLTKSKFATKVNLSDITITKLVKEVARVSGCQIQI